MGVVIFFCVVCRSSKGEEKEEKGQEGDREGSFWSSRWSGSSGRTTTGSTDHRRP